MDPDVEAEDEQWAHICMSLNDSHEWGVRKAVSEKECKIILLFHDLSYVIFE